MMGRLLDFFDDCLAVGLQGTGDHHEAGELQVTFQRVAAHFTHLHARKKKGSRQC